MMDLSVSGTCLHHESQVTADCGNAAVRIPLWVHLG